MAAARPTVPPRRNQRSEGAVQAHPVFGAVGRVECPADRPIRQVQPVGVVAQEAEDSVDVELSQRIEDLAAQSLDPHLAGKVMARMCLAAHTVFVPDGSILPCVMWWAAAQRRQTTKPLP